METEKGLKYDKGKPRMDLIPRSAMVSMGKGFAYGAQKYDDRNWEKGIEFGRLYAALQRHLWSYWNGDEIDDESGLNHLDHAFCCLAMLNEMKDIHPELDDRPNQGYQANPIEKAFTERKNYGTSDRPLTKEEAEHLEELRVSQEKKCRMEAAIEGQFNMNQEQYCECEQTCKR